MLHELQRMFTDFLLSEPGSVPDAALCGAIRAQGIPAVKRLAIYKNNVYSQLIGALGETYPAVRRLTGDEFFRFAATEYIAAHPPRSSALLEFSESFPGFLDGFEPAATVAYLPDVARLEQLYLQSYHAAEAVPLPRSALAMLLREDNPAARLCLHPSARLMTSQFSVSLIWEMNVQPSAIEGRRQVPAGPEYLLIVRPRATVEVRRISRAAHAALAAIGDGLAIGEALEAGNEADPGVDLTAHMLSLAGGETFCSCEEIT